MKFSIVGNMVAAMPLIRQIQAASDHQLGPCCLTGALADSVAASSIPLLLEASPENAFFSSGVDVLVLAIDDTEETLRLARSASQSDRHLVVFPPVVVSTAFGFELHLLLDESSFQIMPVTGRMRLRDLPASEWELPADIRVPVRDIQQVTMEIQVTSDDITVLQQQQQLQALDCVGALGLKYSQITALDSTAVNGSLISRLLTLGASPTSEQTLPPTTITVKAVPSAGTVLRSNEGGMTDRIERPADRNQTQCRMSLKTIRLDGNTNSFEVLDDPPLLPRIVQMCASRELCHQSMQSFATALEMADAVGKSLRRRRTVDVYFDSGSERGVFKSQMTAIGCGVLTWTLLGMMGFLVLAKVTSLSSTSLYIARILWIVPVVLFLLAQLLLPLTRDRTSHK